jgi:hypothetical protein
MKSSTPSSSRNCFFEMGQPLRSRRSRVLSARRLRGSAARALERQAPERGRARRERVVEAGDGVAVGDDLDERGPERAVEEEQRREAAVADY